MLDTNLFFNALQYHKFSHVCCVPCSFAKNLINILINENGNPQYLPAANEFVACSMAAGLKMAGAKPLVLIQSSGLTNAGSCITSLLKPYDIHIAILVSWRTYSAGDSEIQHEHLATALPDLIKAYGADCDVLNDQEVDQALLQLLESDHSSKIIILRKDTFSRIDLKPEYWPNLREYPPRTHYLKLLNRFHGKADTFFIATTGFISREMAWVMPDARVFYMVGNMGGALSVGLGAALAGQRVIVCGGDAEFVMHMGGVTNAGRETLAPGQLIYIIFDNQSNLSTGGQDSRQQHVDYIGIGRHAGMQVYPKTVASEEEFKSAMDVLLLHRSPSLLHVKCSYDPLCNRPDADTIRNSSKQILANGP